MANTSLLLLLALTTTFLLATSAAAFRLSHPCHTSTGGVGPTTLLISISSSSSSSSSHHQTLTIFRIRRLGPHLINGPHPHPHHHHHQHSLPAQIHQHSEPETRPIASKFALGLGSSLEERAKDILVVVIGLLFGVACGALTAASMYLVWSVVVGARNGGGIFGSDGYDEIGEFDEDDDVESPKKVGYVVIPEAAAAVEKVDVGNGKN